MHDSEGCNEDLMMHEQGESDIEEDAQAWDYLKKRVSSNEPKIANNSNDNKQKKMLLEKLSKFHVADKRTPNIIEKYANNTVYKVGPTKYQDGSTKGHWTIVEDLQLFDAVSLNNGKNWKKIAESLPGRTDVQCLHRWQKVLNPQLVKGPWTDEEDNKVLKLVLDKGP